MITLYITSDNGSDLDDGFAAFLASEVEEELSEIEIKIVSHDSSLTREHRDLVNAIWDRWCALSQAARDDWASR